MEIESGEEELMARVIAIGEQNFRTIRENNYFYVDKTEFIADWWLKTGATATLITRPRRFGKTLMMDTVREFFTAEDRDQERLFSGLDVWENETMRRTAGTIPVISLTWSGIKGQNYWVVRKDILRTIAEAYRHFDFVAESEKVDPVLRSRLKNFSSQSRDESDDPAALRDLCIALHQYYGVKPIILLDEYDTPLQEAWLAGYWDDLVEFMKKLMNFTFKSNTSLARGIITGVTRISKESIFSDLNNPMVVTTTSDVFQTSFGFTEAEVFAALDEYGISDREKVKAWYDGFTFGSVTDIYNPWSITSFLEAKKFATYWANTSDNALVNELIRRGNRLIKTDMEELLSGRTIRTPIREEISFRDLDATAVSIWSLLLVTGYLRVVGYDEESDTYELCLTNLEVKRTMEAMIRLWFDAAGNTNYLDFVNAMQAGDTEAMNVTLNALTAEVFSYFDTDGREPERFYHGFVLGLLVTQKNRWRVKSNRESGYGRYDVMLIPVDSAKDDAFVLEFKVRRTASEKTLAESAQAALQQIEAKHYDAELLADGIAKERIRKFGIAFDGKTALVVGGE